MTLYTLEDLQSLARKELQALAKERGIKAKLSWWDLFECIELPLSADGEREFPDGWDSEEEVKQATWNGRMRADPDDAASDAASDIDQLANNLNRLEEKMRKEAGLS